MRENSKHDIILRGHVCLSSRKLLRALLPPHTHTWSEPYEHCVTTSCAVTKICSRRRITDKHRSQTKYTQASVTLLGYEDIRSNYRTNTERPVIPDNLKREILACTAYQKARVGASSRKTSSSPEYLKRRASSIGYNWCAVVSASPA